MPSEGALAPQASQYGRHPLCVKLGPQSEESPQQDKVELSLISAHTLLFRAGFSKQTPNIKGGEEGNLPSHVDSSHQLLVLEASQHTAPTGLKVLMNPGGGQPGCAKPIPTTVPTRV